MQNKYKYLKKFDKFTFLIYNVISEKIFAFLNINLTSIVSPLFLTSHLVPGLNLYGLLL